MEGLNRDGAALFRWSADRLREISDKPDEEQQRMLALLMAFEGQCRISLAYKDARQLAQHSLAMMRSLPPAKETLHAIVIAKEFASDETEKTQLTEEALDIARANRYGWWISLLTTRLAEQAMGRGDFEQAEKLLHEAAAACDEINDPTQMVTVQLGLSGLAYNHDDFTEARRKAEEGLALAQEVGYRAGMMWANGAVADHALLQGDYAAAQAYAQAALKLGQEQEDLVNNAFQLRRLGSAACGLGNYQEARHYFCDGLRTAVAAGYEAATLDVVGEIAWLLHGYGQSGRAAELAGFVLSHPGSLNIIIKRLTPLLAELEGVIPPEVVATAVERGKTLHLGQTVKALLVELSRPLPATRLVVEPPGDQSLADPLTERELEVLQLLAGGLSNYEIAVRLFVGVSTVKTHVNRIFSKLSVKNRTQAVARARELHLL